MNELEQATEQYFDLLSQYLDDHIENLEIDKNLLQRVITIHGEINSLLSFLKYPNGLLSTAPQPSNSPASKD